MKEIRFLTLLFFTTVTACLYGEGTQQPSGAYSLNGQETVHNSKVHYPTPKEWIAFMCDTVLPASIDSFNGAIVGGARIEHDRSFFEDHIDDLVATATAQTNYQLELINDEPGSELVGKGQTPTVQGIRDFLEHHVTKEYIKFNLDKGDKIYLLGENGDWSGGKWVVHAHADGWYYVLTVNGKKYLLGRASCFNNTSEKETFWIEKGKAVIYSAAKPGDTETGNDDPISTPKPHKVRVNGQEIGTTSANGDFNINFTGGNVQVGDITGGKGGSSNNNVEGGGGTDGQNGRDGRDGRNGQDGANGQNGTDVPYPGPGGGNAPNYTDLSARWAESLGSRNYALYDNGQYAAPGFYQNGYFQPYGQVYQSNGYGGWGLTGFGIGFLLGRSFNGGYCNGGWQSGRQQCWGGGQTTYYNSSTVSNMYVNNINQQITRTQTGGFVSNGTGTYPGTNANGKGFVSNGTGTIVRSGNNSSSGNSNASSGGQFAGNSTGSVYRKSVPGNTSGTSPYRPSSTASNPYRTQYSGYSPQASAYRQPPSHSYQGQSASRAGGYSGGYSGGAGRGSAIGRSVGGGHGGHR